MSEATTTENSPFWSQVVQPRRFIEGPKDDQQGPAETTPKPPNNNQSDNVSEEEQRTDDVTGDGAGGSESKDEPLNSRASNKSGVEDTKLMPPPPGPALRAFAAPTMPPPSFIPARALPSSPSKQELT